MWSFKDLEIVKVVDGRAWPLSHRRMLEQAQRRPSLFKIRLKAATPVSEVAPDAAPDAPPVSEVAPATDESLDSLRKQVRALGIKVDRRWGADRLRAEIEGNDALV